MSQENHIDALKGAVAEQMHQPIFNFAPSNKESKLRKLLNFLLTHAEINVDESRNCIEYDIEQKILYNDVDDDWQELIEEYYFYDNIFSSALDVSNSDGIMNKVIFLNILKQYYLEAKKQLLHDPKNQDEIKLKSTDILDYVANIHMEYLSKNNETNYEDIYIIKIIVCYGFIECKILEKPPKVEE